MPVIVGPNVQIGQTVSGPSLPIGNGATYFVTGMTERGSTTTAIPLGSMADYQKFCGNQVNYGFLYNDLTVFFAEGGQLAYVARVVGASSSAGSLVLLDSNGSATLQLLANSVGEWSGSLTVEVVNNGASPGPGGLPNTFSIYLRDSEYSIATATGSAILESYLNMTSPAAAASLMAFSNYVTVTNLGSASSPPANNPATLNNGGAGNGVALSTGYSNTAGVTVQNYLNAASTMFPTSLGAGIAAIPGQQATNISGIVPLNMAANRSTILVGAQGSSNTAAESVCATLKGATGTPGWAGQFWPWVQAPNGQGGVITIPPDGFIAGTRARNILGIGIWQANFGATYAAARYITGTESAIGVVTPNLVQEVYGVGINPIRILGGVPVLYGWQTLSPDPNFKWLNGADVLDQLDFAISQLMEAFVGAPIDAHGNLFTAIAAEIQALLDPMAQAGGLYPLTDLNGNTIDPGYTINISAALNTVQNVSMGTVTVNVAVRLSPAAQLIAVTISKTGFTAAS